MKRFFLILLFLGLVGVVFWFYQRQIKLPVPSPVIVNVGPMKIISPAFENNQNIPQKYTCDGDGVNPPLEFRDVPKEAKTLALIVDDPDAPAGTWVHWLLWNMPSEVRQIAENSVPEKAIVGQGSSGQNVYGGPCPPSGVHHYFFKLFALDAKLNLTSFSSADKFMEAVQGHIISQTQLVGLYGRVGQ